MESNINEKIKPKQKVVQTQNTAINQQLEELKNENKELFLKITEFLNAQCKQMRDNSDLKNILEQLSIKRAAYLAYKEKNNKVNLASKENEMLKELLDCFNNINKHSIKPFHIIAEDYELNINIERNNYFEIFGIRKITISKTYEKLIELLSFYEFYIKENKIGCEKSKKESMNNKIESNINEKIKPKQKVVQTQNTTINKQLEELKNENEGLFLKIKEFLNAQCKQMRDNSNLKKILEQLSIKRELYKKENNEENLTSKENMMLKKLLDCFNFFNYTIEPFHILAEYYELNINKEGDNYNKISEIYEKLNELLDIYKFKLKEIDYEKRRKVTVALKTLMNAEHGWNNSKRFSELVEIFKNELENLLNSKVGFKYSECKNLEEKIEYRLKYGLSENENNSVYRNLEEKLHVIECGFKYGFLGIANNFNFKNSIYAYTKLNKFVEKFEDILNKAKNLIKSGKIKKGIFLRNEIKNRYEYTHKEYKEYLRLLSEKHNYLIIGARKDGYFFKDLSYKEKLRINDFKYYEKYLNEYYEKLLNDMAWSFKYGNDEFYDKALDLAKVVKNHNGVYNFTEEEKAIIDEVYKRVNEELKAFEEIEADINNFQSSLDKYLNYLKENVFKDNQFRILKDYIK